MRSEETPAPEASSSGAGIGSESPEAKARSRALRVLARREKSRAGLTLQLRRAGFASPVVRQVLDELEEKGLVDDRRYCRLYLSQQARLRPRSLRLMERDLKQEGIAGEIVSQAIADLGREISEADLAVSAARKKLRVCGGDAGRLERLLTARGFGRSDIRDAVRVVTGEAPAETGEEPESPDDL
jgi:regulatory protein